MDDMIEKELSPSTLHQVASAIRPYQQRDLNNVASLVHKNSRKPRGRYGRGLPKKGKLFTYNPFALTLDITANALL